MKCASIVGPETCSAWSKRCLEKHCLLKDLHLTGWFPFGSLNSPIGLEYGSEDDFPPVPSIGAWRERHDEVGIDPASRGKNPHLYHRDVERIDSAIFDEITAALARGDRVELRGFGAFSVKKRDARIGRNPRTGAAVNVAEKHVPFFKTGKLLRERLNSR